ncbi:MAG: replicative DNA helicase [Spirochaeta sp. LUC14_002_19_P3]|nr:MAG: replicative DNA helicase [Spirochaeta sp. LUC14_002_19_P3]
MKETLPPYNEEAEMATLGALLLNFSTRLLDDVRQHVNPEDFFKGAHQLIFKSIIRLSDRGEGVDILTLTDDLTAAGNIDKAGGAAYCASLTTRVPSTANVSYYAKIVKETGIRRSLLNTARTMMTSSYDESIDVRRTIEETEKAIFELIDNQRRSELKPALTVLPETFQIIEERGKMKKSYTGIPSGFSEIDNLTSGFQNSEVTILGARPSIGKTALALSMASNIAIKEKIACGFFTLEMTAVSLMMRVVSSVSNIDSNKIRTGLLSPSEYSKLTGAAGQIYEAPLILQDTPNIPLLDLRSLARQMVTKHNVKIIFIDYIGLISPEDTSLPRYEQISSISRSLKALARELNIPIVALSQVGRQTEGKVPTLADLRESGALEQDADVVLLLYRERLDKEEPEQMGMNPIETKLIIAKQRNGPTGTVKLHFIPRFTRFQNYSYD